MLTARTLVYGLTGAGFSVTSLFRPYLGLLALAFLYFFSPDLYGAEEYVKPVLWITVCATIGYVVGKKSAGLLAGTRWIIMFLVLYGLATVFASQPGPFTIDRLILHAKILVAAFLIVKLCDSPQRLGGFVAAMLAGSLWFVKVAIGAWIFYGFSGSTRVDVAVGQGGKSNYLAWILAAFTPFILYKVIRGKSWQRITAFVLAPLFLTAIVSTGSRGGLLCLVASCGMFMLLLRRFKMMLLLTLVACFFIAIAPAEYMDRISTITLDPAKMDNSTLARYQNVQAGIKIARDNPMFGTGLATFPQAKMPYLTEDYKGKPIHIVHNTYIQMASEVGIPFLLVFLMFTVWIVWKLLPVTKGNFSKEDLDHIEWVRIGVLSALAATWVQMVKSDIAHYDVLWWLYAIAIVVHRLRTQAASADALSNVSNKFKLRIPGKTVGAGS